MKARNNCRTRHAAKGFHRRLTMSFACAALLLGTAPLYADEQGAIETPVELMNPSERAHIERLLSEELQQVANRKTWFEGQTQPLHIVATFDLRTGQVLIDIGAQYGPKSATAEMEDLQGYLSATTEQLLSHRVPYHGIKLIFGGKDMYYFHPEQWRAPRPLPLRQTSAQSSGDVLSV